MQKVFYYVGDFESSFYTDHFIDLKNPEISLNHIRLTGLKKINNTEEIKSFRKRKKRPFLEGDFLGESQLYFESSQLIPFFDVFNQFLINEVKIHGVRKIENRFHGKLTGRICVRQGGGLVSKPISNKPKSKASATRKKKNLIPLDKMKGCSPFSRNSSNLNSGENELHNESMNGSDHLVNNNFSDNKGCSPMRNSGCSPIGNGCSPIGNGCSPIGNGCSPIGGGCLSLGSGCTSLIGSILSLLFWLWILSLIFRSCDTVTDTIQQNDNRDNYDYDDDDQGVNYDDYLEDILYADSISDMDTDNNEIEQSEVDFTDNDINEEDNETVEVDSTNEDGVIMEIEFIEFLTNSMELKPSSYSSLDKLAEFLLINRKIQAVIYGHTDNVGDESHNQLLSQERAQSVVYYLIKAGVDENRLDAIGVGSKYPRATNETEEGRSKNRRVEVRFKVK